MSYREETCACCSSQLVPGDPRARDRCGVYCMRVRCIARHQRSHYENPTLECTLELALQTAHIIRRNKAQELRDQEAA